MIGSSKWMEMKRTPHLFEALDKIFRTAGACKLETAIKSYELFAVFGLVFQESTSVSVLRLLAWIEGW